MGKIIKLGMVFEIGNAPDFGSIEAGQDGALTLLDEDVGKLNSALTRAACLPMLAQGCTFSIPGGTNAVVADQPAVWRYHAESDRWYELISGDSDEHRVYFYSGNMLTDSQTVDDGGTAVYGGATPSKAETERYTYSFAGWNADPGAVSADSDALKNVTANRTVYAVFTASEKTFTVTFKNNTETVYTASSVAYDGTAVYGGETPTKADDEQYSYTFAGWNADPGAVSADSDALKNVTANRTVYAVFTASEKTFTVTFKNNTETVYTASSVAYDGTAVYGGETPTKADDEQYSYTFAGWNADPEAEEPDEDALKNVKADRTVYAIFATEGEGNGE